MGNKKQPGTVGGERGARARRTAPEPTAPKMPAAPEQAGAPPPPVRLLTAVPTEEIAQARTANVTMRMPLPIDRAMTVRADREQVNRGELLAWCFLVLEELQTLGREWSDERILAYVRNLQEARDTGALLAWVLDWRPNRPPATSRRGRRPRLDAFAPRATTTATTTATPEDAADDSQD